MYANYQIVEKDDDGKVISETETNQKIEIIIKGEAKEEILEDLKKMGISNSTMFPEIDNIANEIKNSYSKKP